MSAAAGASARELPVARSILVADGHCDSADMIAEALEMQGYEVQVAYGPLSAILIAVLFQPELAILDVDAPTMDGYELAAALRVDLPECKFIALTGGATELGACVANEQAFTAI